MNGRMSDFFGLRDLTITEVVETYDRVACTAQAAPTSCPDCPSGTAARSHQVIDTTVWDTPSRGKPTSIRIKRKRFQCRGCGGTFSHPWPESVHDIYPATHRLVHHVEAQASKRPVAAIARDVGLPPSTVRSIAMKLAHRLHEHHRFPTPVILGIDDLRLKKRWYTVVTDGQSGRAIALVEGGREIDVRRELKRRQLNLASVHCVVSDLGATNLAVVRNLFPNAIHVADKWHVLKGAQEALSLVINQEIDRLRKTPGREDEAKTIRAAKPLIMKGRATRGPDHKLQLELELDVVAPIVRHHARIGRAFWAKMRLHLAYASTSRSEALAQAVRFYRRATHPSIAKEMATIIARLKRNREMILNYFLVRDSAGVLIGPTTGPTERRNSSIRQIWRSGRGITSLPYLSLRALYEPWMLDAEILLCGAHDCEAVDGPLPPARRLAPVADRSATRCAACRARVGG